MTARPQPATLDEFSDGVITAFAGGSNAHAALCLTLTSAVHVHLRGSRYRAFGSDALVLTGSSGRSPDLTVSCDDRDLGDLYETGISFPKLIVEVLSESTAAVDRGAKLDEYRALATLEDYVLVDARRRWVATYLRIVHEWIASRQMSDGTPCLASVDLTLDIATLYADAGP